jgi:hypothetical protein
MAKFLTRILIVFIKRKFDLKVWANKVKRNVFGANAYLKGVNQFPLFFIVK